MLTSLKARERRFHHGYVCPRCRSAQVQRWGRGLDPRGQAWVCPAGRPHSGVLLGMTGTDTALSMAQAASGRPQCIIVAGPNGAGKTTTALGLASEWHKVPRIVNPDEIAGGLSGAPELGALEAGKLALKAQARYMAHRQDFAMETTLSGRRWPKFLDALDAADYQVTLYYLWVADPAACIARVRTRVMKGGHGVAEDEARLTIRRPWRKGRSRLGRRSRRMGGPATRHSHEDDHTPLTTSDRMTYDPQHQNDPPAMRDALDYANRALRREQAVHKALGVPWAVWREGAVHWIAPEELPDLRPEDRAQLPDSSAPPPLQTRPLGARVG